MAEKREQYFAQSRSNEIKVSKKEQWECERKKMLEMNFLPTDMAGDYQCMHQDMHKIKVTLEERWQRMEMQLTPIRSLSHVRLGYTSEPKVAQP